jgi:tripartite-type tricarboxylate transporter receptor subunit TctC
MFRTATGVAAVLIAALFSATAAAQYPTKPIRLLVAFPAGGGPDIVARLLGPKLSETLGQPVIVENRVGSNGNIAAEVVAKSAPDGYTLLLGQDSLFAINPHVYSSMPIDPNKELAAIASLVSNGFFIAVHPSLPARTLAEFIDWAKKANPPMHYASGGNGSQHHMTMERLKARAGFEMVHVPYKGGAPATTATVAGEVPAMMSGTSTAPQIRAGKLRALAFSGAKRSSILPDVPTIAETYPDFVMVQWYGLFGPVGLPDTISARLRNEAHRGMQQPDTVEKLKNAGGVEPWVLTPDEFAKEIRNDYVKYAKLVKDLGIKAD